MELFQSYGRRGQAEGWHNKQGPASCKFLPWGRVSTMGGMREWCGGAGLVEGVGDRQAGADSHRHWLQAPRQRPFSLPKVADPAVLAVCVRQQTTARSRSQWPTLPLVMRTFFTRHSHCPLVTSGLHYVLFCPFSEVGEAARGMAWQGRNPARGKDDCRERTGFGGRPINLEQRRTTKKAWVQKKCATHLILLIFTFK